MRRQESTPTHSQAPDPEPTPPWGRLRNQDTAATTGAASPRRQGAVGSAQPAQLLTPVQRVPTSIPALGVA